MKELKILMFDMILHFKFIYNLKKLQLWQFKQSTWLCFHPKFQAPSLHKRFYILGLTNSSTIW